MLRLRNLALRPDVTETPGSGRPPVPPDPPRARRTADPLGPNSALGARLRALYTGFESEPVPSDLIALLEQLDEAERRGDV